MRLEAAALNADECARDLLRDLHQPNVKIFWADLIGTAVVGWGGFWIFLKPGLSFLSLTALLVAALALYRGLCFIHELTHVRPKALPGLETAWNFFFGAPLLLPSFVYVGVHQDHHKLTTYGTSQDPEYLPFAKSNVMMLAFVAHSVLIPLFLFLRFVILTPIALAIPPLHRWLAVHASALSMNLGYKRAVTAQSLRYMRTWEAFTFSLWGMLLIGVAGGSISWRALAAWYAVTAAVCVINTLRTLGAHEYESAGSPMDRTAQLLDSIDTPGALWTELWAPVGLRYHALHHYFPGIPYHNLPEAHRRLVASMPPDAAYRKTINSGLWQSLRELYARGRTTRLSLVPNSGAHRSAESMDIAREP